MNQHIKQFLQKLWDGIRTHPDLHTRTYNLGGRVYDRMALIDSKTYYVRVTFDVHPVTNQVAILSTTVEEVPGLN